MRSAYPIGRPPPLVYPSAREPPPENEMLRARKLREEQFFYFNLTPCRWCIQDGGLQAIWQFVTSPWENNRRILMMIDEHCCMPRIAPEVGIRPISSA